MADSIKRENEINRQMKIDKKQQIKELDVKMANDYIEMVNKQEQAQRDAIQKREDRVKQFMSKMEQGALAEDNRKHQLINDQIQHYEEKKQVEEKRDTELRKRRQEHLK